MTNELSFQEAAIVKALLLQKFKNHDIAALFGVNPRAVSHIKNGICYAGIEPNFGHGLLPKDVTTPKFQLIQQLRSK